MVGEPSARRAPLNRDRVLHAAVTLADDAGLDAVSMRRLAQELGVVPMALYKHVAHKDELFDGMVDVVVAEIGPPDPDATGVAAVRQRVLAARRALLRHRWAYRLLTSRTAPTPAVLAHQDGIIGMFRAGGFSVDLTHHAMHALGSRVLGFTQELLDSAPAEDPAAQAAGLRLMAGTYPHIVEIALRADHDGGSTVGPGCDDQFEFEFALDVLLDGFERLRAQGWSSAGGPQ